MFDDKRSKKVLLVAHCILNQNAKIDHCACFPGAIPELAHFLVDSGVGLIQMPCPELRCLGLARQVEQGSKTTIESEDTRVAQQMKEMHSVSICHKLINDLINQLGEYRKNGFEILGVIGINGSPTCGVETNWSSDREMAGPGVFVKMLADESRKYGVGLNMRGIKAYEMPAALDAAKSLCGGSD